MGKQIYFYQTDDDILSFGEFLAAQNLKLFKYNKTEEAEKLSVWENERFFFIANQNMQDKGCFVEYMLPTRSHNRMVPENKIGIESGRIYLANNCYDEDSIKIYNALVKYIKKHYIYSKDARCYFSNDFIEMYKSDKYHII